MLAPLRLRWVASTTLAGVMAAHVLLETACDSLFLANVSVDRLPWVTIAVAILAVLASRGRSGESHRTALLALQLGAAVGTGAFAVLVADGRSWVYYALSLWAGIVTSLIVVRFWLVLGDLFTIVEGKRFFAGIALGGAAGALGGSVIATLLAPGFGGRGLLAASAVAYALSGIGPLVALAGIRPGRPRGFAEDPNPTESLSANLGRLLSDAYASRIAMLVMLGGVTLTLGDYLFKSVIAEEIPAAALATWLSRIYLGLNFLSLSMLAIGVTPILRGLGIDRSLSVLPAGIALCALGTLSIGAVPAVIALKLYDGTLRYSLHRTASELLYLPMSSRLRASIKGAIDIVGQTFAKAVASALLLGLVLFPSPRIAVALAVLVAAGVWASSSLLLRRAYLDVFRRTLREGMIETEIEHPELDLDSVGSLIRALSDADERHVIAAMRILAERGHTSWIPSLILYHPSASVVAHALDLFAATSRDDLDAFLDRLTEHEDAIVRAAAVRATWVTAPDVPRLEALRNNTCAVVRVSSVAGLLAHGAVPESEYEASLREALDYPTYEPRLAAATAARLAYHPVMRTALVRMASDSDFEVAQEAVRAMAESRDPWFTPVLVGLLGDRRIRDGVRRALIDRGEPALEVLSRALVDRWTPIPVLRHIPRTIALFGSPAAARTLVDCLSRVDSGMVRFKLLRGLETLVGQRRRRDGIGSPGRAIALDRARIRAELDRTLGRSLELFEMEILMADVQRSAPRLATPGGELVVDLLRDKRELATGRLFMLLGLLHPSEDFRAIEDALADGSGAGQASAQELIETLLSRDVAAQILRLVSSQRGEIRGAVVEGSLDERTTRYATAIAELLGDDSRSVRAVAMYHAGEVGIALDAVQPSDERQRTGEAGTIDLRERAVAALRNLGEGGPRPPFSPLPAS